MLSPVSGWRWQEGEDADGGRCLERFCAWPKGTAGSPVPRYHVLSCPWSCPSRSTSPTRSSEQVGQSRREFHFTCVEERKHIDCSEKVIEGSCWRLGNQPLGIVHINLLYAYESLSFTVFLLCCFFLRCTKEWTAVVWSIHSVFG